MRIYLLTSNKYTTKICPINLHFLNKYWPGNEVTVVGYEDVLRLKDLPENVDVHCLGNQSSFGRTWTNALIPFFQNVPEDYFALIFDDHILMNDVNLSDINLLEEQFLMKRVDKAMIGGGISLSSAHHYDENLLIFDQAADYRMSLHPAIWTKNYFLHYLRPNMTSWDFELKNDAKYDGGKIINLKYLYPQERHPYSYLELYTKGDININERGEVVSAQPSSKFFLQEDIKYIWDNIHNVEI